MGLSLDETNEEEEEADCENSIEETVPDVEETKMEELD